MTRNLLQALSTYLVGMFVEFEFLFQCSWRSGKTCKTLKKGNILKMFGKTWKSQGKIKQKLGSQGKVKEF